MIKDFKPIQWEFNLKEVKNILQKEDSREYDLEEIEYTELEEGQVIQEIRWGLIRQEITSNVTKRELLDWFARVSIPKRDWCENVTCIDLFYIAMECGINIIDLEE